ncbi:dUTP diphosphatase [Faecalibacterium prausnitzii]
MNLNKLFELQAKLDKRIYKEHPPKEGEDRLAEKILALQVELGELANELPEVFKFWSNKKNNYEKALEELVDCLHFILSIGLELDFTAIDVWKVKEATTINQFIECFGTIYNMHFQKRVNGEVTIEMYEHLFACFIGLGEMLGFTWDQVKQGYLAKNKINHQRQESGY